MQVDNKKHSCKKELREADLKATSARLAVLEMLEKNHNPLDVNTISKYLLRHNIKADQATVFRIVNAFTQKGITRQIQLNESKFRYELSSGKDHHHFTCQNCGFIEDIADCGIEVLQKKIGKKKKFIIKSHSLEFFGFCRNCQQ